VGVSPTRQPLQPEATGAVMEATKWLKVRRLPKPCQHLPKARGGERGLTLGLEDKQVARLLLPTVARLQLMIVSNARLPDPRFYPSS
jgi:hypothetical protein